MEVKQKSKNVEKLFEQGKIALSNMDFELAVKFFRKALNVSPNETYIMDALAEVLLQVGDSSEAYELLIKSTRTQPDVNPSKWCYLAQLQESFDAVSSYQKAIQIASSELPSLCNEEEIKAHQKLIAKTFCSIADMYLTDLCKNRLKLYQYFYF